MKLLCRQSRKMLDWCLSLPSRYFGTVYITFGESKYGYFYLKATTGINFHFWPWENNWYYISPLALKKNKSIKLNNKKRSNIIDIRHMTAHECDIWEKMKNRDEPHNCLGFMPGITFQLMERKRGSVVKIKHHGLFLLLGGHTRGIVVFLSWR